MFLKNGNIISKMKRSKVTDYAALTIGHSNFKLYRCIGHIMLKVLSNILCDLDPKVKVIGQKAGICDGVQSTSALVLYRKMTCNWFVKLSLYNTIHL